MSPVAGQPGRPPHKPCFRTACPETPQKNIEFLPLAAKVHPPQSASNAVPTSGQPGSVSLPRDGFSHPVQKIRCISGCECIELALYICDMPFQIGGGLACLSE